MRRLAELAAAATLADVLLLPGARCHKLTADLARPRGRFAVSLRQPYRLVFEVANDPVPTTADGGVDAGQVTSVEIIEVINYHG